MYELHSCPTPNFIYWVILSMTKEIILSLDYFETFGNSVKAFWNYPN